MKNVILISTFVLIASTLSLADVIIYHETTPEGKCAVKYQATDGEEIRGFALDISVDGGQTIDGISGYHKGQSTEQAQGYGMFPSNFNRFIIVDANTGEADDWDSNDYTPVADANDPVARGGLGTSGITVELVSFYSIDNSAAAPGDEGILFELDISGECNITYALNAKRGGIVLTHPYQEISNIDLQSAPFVPATEPPPFDPPHPDYEEWVAVGQPECWTYKRQCHGDADGQKQGNVKIGYHYVGNDDLAIFLSAYDVLEPASGITPSGPGIHTIPNGICADFNRGLQGNPKQGYTRVGTDDLAILLTYWETLEPATGTTPSGPGIPSDDCGGSVDP